MTKIIITIGLIANVLMMISMVKPMLASMTRMGVSPAGSFALIVKMLIMPLASIFVFAGVSFAKIGDWLSGIAVGDKVYGRFAAAELRKNLGADIDVVIPHKSGYAMVEMRDLGHKLACLPARNYSAR